MARALFNGVLIRDKQVVAVRPKKELESFFKVSYECQEKVLLATPTGFEPAISALTGQCVKPLHHGAALCAMRRLPYRGQAGRAI